MSEEQEKTTPAEGTLEAEAEETTEAPATEEQPDLLAEKEQEIAKLKSELAQAKDQYIRNLAELENFKRRKTEETKERLKYAASGLARSIITSLDNLELALNHANPGEDENYANFVQGINMVKGQMLEALKAHDIQRMDPKGEKFDPNQHEAMGVLETSEVADGHVAQVMMAGYLLHDRVIRPAMVQVGKTPSATPNNPEETA